MAAVVTGIKPTGGAHLGNYLGMIRPALRLAEQHESYCFIADHHALNTGPNPAELRRRTLEIAATLLGLGLDPGRTALYRQSDVPEVFELASILGCVTPKGLLNRAHAYKAAVEENRRLGRDADAGVNAGLYTYPVLMAADILCPAADLVPVGLDQQQHLEMTRDLARAFNARYDDVLNLPQAAIDEAVMTVIGTDGRKMSKSHGNTIPILASAERLRAAVMRIVTDDRPVEAPKDPESDHVFRLFSLVAPGDEVGEMRARYVAGGLRYVDAKQRLFEVLDAMFIEARGRARELLGRPDDLRALLDEGAARARRRGEATMEAVRSAIGTSHRAGARGASGESRTRPPEQASARR